MEDHYDIRAVQELLDHKDVKTTMIYTHTRIADARYRPLTSISVTWHRSGPTAASTSGYQQSCDTPG